MAKKPSSKPSQHQRYDKKQIVISSVHKPTPNSPRPILTNTPNKKEGK